MEAKLGFNGYTGYKKVFEKRAAQTETQDCVVPDSLPDIASIVYTSGSVLIRSKDVAEGHVRMEANIPARVSFYGEEEGRLCCLDVNVPFYISAEDPAIRDGSVCTAELSLRRLETRILNPRKVSVRAEVEVGIECFAEEATEFATAPADESDSIHVLEREAELTSICCVTEKTFVLTDEFDLPADRNGASEILGQSADVVVQELRDLGTKLILRGSVRSTLLLRGEDDELRTASFSTAFSQIVETQSELDETLCEARMLTSGMYYELTPGTDGRGVTMELHLVAQALVYARRSVRYLADAYSNGFALTLQRQPRDLILYGREVLLRESFSAQLDTAGEPEAVIACSIVPVSWSCEGCEIMLQLLARSCWRGGGAVFCGERMLTHRLKADVESDAVKLCGVSVTDVNAVPGNGGIEVRIALELRGFTVRRTQLDCISAIEYDAEAPLETDDQPTLVILRPGPDASLWTLAKENCSTVEAICAANGLAEEELTHDSFLLIPKTL